MFSSLEIRNYRNLKHLRLESLSRINLITGKNNTGKSSLLEAFSIYITKGDINWILQLLQERGENYSNERRPGLLAKNVPEDNLRTVRSLFHNRAFSLESEDSLYIGEIENTLFGKDISSKYINISFVAFTNEVIKVERLDPSTGEGRLINKIERKLLSSDDLNNFPNYQLAIAIRTIEEFYEIPLNSDRLSRLPFRDRGTSTNMQYIKTRNIDKETNGRLWDNIALTEKEFFINEAVRLIEPDEEGIAFVGNDDHTSFRSPVIKVKNSNHVLPLKSMGDGINRLLTIALALANAENGYLLIDEFENGLHHSVQEKLWEIIFDLSKKLNVQVFVTTHSNDCIKAFENVLNNGKQNPKDGKLIRLDVKNGQVKEVEFDAEELKTITEQNIEIR